MVNRLKVLKYMGILTVMKLGVFAISALSLSIALVWILVYCPRVINDKFTDRAVSNNDEKVHANAAEYFRHFERKLEENLEELEKNDPQVEVDDRKKHAGAKATIPRDLFTDEAFENMISQLTKEQLDGYEFVVSSMNVTIYKKPKKNNLFEYKLYALLPHATPEILTTVFLDSDYRVEWDQYVTDLYFVQKNEQGPDVIYFDVDFPWPLANRDYVYARETRKIMRNGKEHYVIIMHSVAEHNIPVKKGAVRVDDFHQSLAVEPYEGGSRAFIHYYDDPKGSIPSWLINWVAKSGIPGFVKDIQRACKGFDEYRKRKGLM